MSNPYQIINEKTWERATHCMVFRTTSVELAFFVDGLHIGQFVAKLQKYFDECEI